MNDSLGDRIKSQYEDRTRYKLPRRTYTIIRVDGKAFHTLLKNAIKPFDDNFIIAMDETALALCREIQNVKLAYIQSDEISLLLTDFDKITTEQWFDGNIQKMVSVAASIATANFNFIYSLAINPPAYFDARVFTIPDKQEVANYFIWRQKDATKNSIQMVARTLYTHKELEGVGLDQLQELIFQKGQNWNDLASHYKRGRCVANNGLAGWGVIDVPIFTQDTEFLNKYINKSLAEVDTEI